MTRFRGKWIDGEVFGKEDRGNNGRYHLYSGECRDPFDPALEGRIRVIARQVGGKYRTFLGLDFRPGGQGEGGEALFRKRIQLTGCWDDPALLRLVVDTLLVPGPVASTGREPLFWLSGLSEVPDVEGWRPEPPKNKVYRRRPSDMPARASRFAGLWLELDKDLRKGEKKRQAIHAAFSSPPSDGPLSGKILVEYVYGEGYLLRVQAQSGQSSLVLLNRYGRYEEARQAGLEWASLLAYRNG
jgi:hypothetical protein